MSDWNIEPTDLFKRRFKKYKKKNPNETEAVLNNLDTFMRSLNNGDKPQAGFIHREANGVLAIDQQGAKGSLKQTRLYIYAYKIENTVFQITIGDKNSQKSDISDCRDFIKKLRKESENGKTL
jgi:hypothetical protein